MLCSGTLEGQRACCRTVGGERSLEPEYGEPGMPQEEVWTLAGS